jgi:hypothetical protein
VNVIWKYELSVTDNQEFLMHEGAQVLSVGDQNGKLCVWVMMDTTKPVRPKHFCIVGTGQSFSVECPPKRFVGTVIMSRFVWHVFEVM